MTEKDNLTVVISAQASQFHEEMGEVLEKLEALSSTVETMTGSAQAVATNYAKMGKAMMIANIGAKVLMKSVQVIGKAVGNMAMKVFEGGTALSRMRISTDVLARNMGISAGEIDNLRDSLSEANTYGLKAEQVISSLARTGLIEMAQGTGEANSQLAEMYPSIWKVNEGLQAMDGRTGETVTGVNALVLSMKDLGASAGEGSSEAISKLTDFINRGQTGAVEGMIAIGNLGTEYREFANALGKDRNELSATEEAQARLNIVMREGQKAVGSYAQSYTTAGKMMDSLKDASTSIFEELGAMLEPLFATVSSAVLQFVQGVRNWLRANGQTFRDWAIKVSAHIVYVIRMIGSLLARIPVLGEHMKGLANFSFPEVKASATADGIDKVGSAVEDTTDATGKLKKEMQGLAGFDEMTVLNQKESGGGGGGGGIGGGAGIGGALGDLGFGGMTNEVADKMAELEEQVKAKLDPIIQKIKDFFAPMVKLWQEQVSPAFDGLMANIKELWASIMDSPIGDILTTIAQILGVIIVVAINIVIGAISGLVAIIKWQFEMWKWSFEVTMELIAQLIVFFRHFGENMKKIWEAITSWFVEKWEIAVDNFEMMIDNIKGYFEDFGNKLKEVWDAIVLLFNYAIYRIKKFVFQLILNMVLRWFKFRDDVIEIWENIKAGIRSVVDKIRDWVVARINNIISVFVAIWTTAKWVFSAVGNWIWDKISWAVDKVKGAISSLKTGFKGFFTNIAESIKVPINWIIDKINGMIRKMNKWRIPVILENGLNIGELPKLATGGVVNNPTIAMLGEAGAEAVVPLENNTGWIDKLAGQMGGGGGQIHLTVKVGEDKVGEKIIEYINDKNTRTNLNTLNI